MTSVGDHECMCAWGDMARALPWRALACVECHRLRSVARRFLICRMQCLKKCDQSSRLRWAEVLPVGRHISSPLDYLTNQLIFRQAESNSVERWPALTSFVV